MSRREGSHRARRPSVDLLEGRYLLSQVFGHELARPVGSVAAEQSHSGVVTLENDSIASARGARTATTDKTEDSLRDNDDVVAGGSRGRGEQISSVPASTAPFRPEQAILPTSSVALARPSVAVPPSHEPSFGLPTSGVGGPPSAGGSIGLEVARGFRPHSTQASRGGAAFFKFPVRIVLEAVLLPARSTGSSHAVEALGLRPQGADILAEFLPSDATAIERAVDRFFDQLDKLGEDLSSRADPLDLLPEPLAWLVAFGSVEVARRWLVRGDEPDGPRRRAARAALPYHPPGSGISATEPGWPSL